MSEIKDGGPAFPVCPPVDESGRTAVNYPFPEPGMTLRDYFAAKAMQGWLASYAPEDTPRPIDIAGFSYEVADAMLRAREVQP